MQGYQPRKRVINEKCLPYKARRCTSLRLKKKKIRKKKLITRISSFTLLNKHNGHPFPTKQNMP